MTMSNRASYDLPCIPEIAESYMISKRLAESTKVVVDFDGLSATPAEGLSAASSAN